MMARQKTYILPVISPFIRFCSLTHYAYRFLTTYTLSTNKNYSQCDRWKLREDVYDLSNKLNSDQQRAHKGFSVAP